MSTPHKYKRYVTSHYRGGCGNFAEIKFMGSDNPSKWNMKKKQVFGEMADAIFWEIGYIHRGQLAYQTNPRHTGFSPSYFLPRQNPPLPYWWCRDGDWLPYWGEATEQRSKIMKEIRMYWLNLWFGKTIPEIKNTIKDITPLPEDIINELPQYFEYPYQHKTL